MASVFGKLAVPMCVTDWLSVCVCGRGGKAQQQSSTSRTNSDYNNNYEGRSVRLSCDTWAPIKWIHMRVKKRGERARRSRPPEAGAQNRSEEEHKADGEKDNKNKLSGQKHDCCCCFFTYSHSFVFVLVSEFRHNSISVKFSFLPDFVFFFCFSCGNRCSCFSAQSSKTRGRGGGGFARGF